LELVKQAQSAPSILIVEDEKIVRNLLATIIPRKFPGIPIYLAENGRMGVELFKEHSPTIVITDINMPVMDGILMAREIRAANADTRLIAVTAYSDDQGYQEKMDEIGFHDCLSKPLEFGKLYAAIEKCLDEIA